MGIGLNGSKLSKLWSQVKGSGLDRKRRGVGFTAASSPHAAPTAAATWKISS